MMQLTLRPICLCSASMVRLVYGFVTEQREGMPFQLRRRRIWIQEEGGREGRDHFVASLQVVTGNLFLFICSGCPCPGASEHVRALFLGRASLRRVCRMWIVDAAHCQLICVRLFGNRGAGMRPTERPTNQSKSNFYTPPNAECLCSGIFAASLRRRRGRALQRGKVRELHNGGAAAVECN